MCAKWRKEEPEAQKDRRRERKTREGQAEGVKH